MNFSTNGPTGSFIASVAMQAVFSDAAWVSAMLEFEAALTGALSQHGVIDSTAATHIVACCNAGLFDHEQLARASAAGGNLAGALLNQLGAVVSARNADAASYVHWGAASQDLIDTAMVMRLRAALDLIDTDLTRLAMVLAQRADLHRHTAQVGRTGMQHTSPITFGLKAASWLDGLLRHQQRLLALRPRLLVLQFGGAAGTLAGLGKEALPVAESLAAALDLTLPDMPWHSQRDRFAEVATTLGLLTGSLGKMARDMMLLIQTEVAELTGPVAAGAGSALSLNRPCRRTATGCAVALAAAQQVPSLVAIMLSGMVPEHERDLGSLQAEWDTLPHIVQLCAAALEQMRLVATVMIVDATRMRSNLDITRGQIMAEAVALALTRKLGRQQARAIVAQACQKAMHSGQHLRDQLDQDPAVGAQLSALELDLLLEPAGYSGQAASFVNRVLQSQRQWQGMPSPKGITEMPLINNGNVHLHYQVEGDMDAPFLILSNSLGTSLEIWAPQMPAMLEHFRVLRYDARGHGQSGVPDGPYTIAEMGADVITLMDHLGVVRAHFCGISLGGMIGIWLAAHHPARIDHLVLSNTAALLGPAERWDTRIEQVNQGGMSTIAAVVVEGWFTRDFQEHAVRQVSVVRDMLVHMPDAGYIAGCMAIRDADLRDILANINAPTLVIGGKHDKATAAAQSRQLAEHINGARYVELNAAHLSTWEVAQSFNTQVVDFLLAKA